MKRAYAESSDRSDQRATQEHPSAPLPVVDAPLASEIRVPFGETGLNIFPVILGGGEFAWGADDKASQLILDRFADLGGNALHTSDTFASGRSELIIGRWLRRTGVRDRMVLTSRIGGHPDNRGLDSVNLVRAVEASLQRLGVDTLDVLYLDGSDDRTHLEDTLATADWLVEAGKIRALGAASFTPERLVEARILSAAGYPRIDIVAVPHNILRRQDFHTDMRLVTSAQSIAVTPTHPLEHGFLSGVYRTRAQIEMGVRGTQHRAHMNRRGTRVLRVLDGIAEELRTTHAAVALAWLLGQRGITAPIASAFTPRHVDEFVRAAGVHLSRGHLSELEKVS